MPAIVNTILDSTGFRIFFAAWTGFYLWQIIHGDEGSQGLNFGWLVAGFVAGMIILGSTVQEGT